MIRTFISYLTIFVILFQANASLIFYSFVGLGVIQSKAAFAQDSDTPLLDDLKQKYNLNDPRRNHQDGRLSEKITKQMNAPSVDLSQRLMKGLEAAQQSNKTYDFSQYQRPGGFQASDRSKALSIGLSHGAPSVNENTNEINVKYAKEGTRKLTRNQHGEVVIEKTANASNVQFNEGVKKEDLVSNEVYNSDHVFDTPNGYGDANEVRANVRNSHTRYSTGANSTGRAYQTLTAEIDRAINTDIDPNVAFLQPSKNVFNQVNSNSGEFFQACSSSTSNEERKLNFPTYTEHTCQVTRADNPFFCEVERELRIPMVVSGDNWSSCGVGCYELSLGEPGEDYFDGGKCSVFSESVIVGLNLEDGIELESVSTSGGVDDHMELLIDGSVAFSVVDGAMSYTKSVGDARKCELAKHTRFGGDVTYGVKRHITAGKKANYNITVNTKVADKGEMNVSLKFRFRDKTGKGFGEIVTQYPEGCADKVSSQIKEAGGINKLYEQGVSEEDIEYSFCRYDDITPLEVGSRDFPQQFLDMLDPFYPGDDGNKTWKYEMAGYACDPFGGGKYCIIDPVSLEQVCYTWKDLREMPDLCAELKENPSCSEIKRECTTEGWFDGDIGYNDDGTVVENEEYCFNETVTFRCEQENEVTYQSQSTKTTCDGALPCTGGDCDFGENEKNGRFLEAAVKANVLQNVDGDFSCEVPTDPSTCRIFDGEAEYCSWEVTGLGMDCCESPGGLNIIAYVAAAQGMLKANRMAADGVFGETAQQGAQAVIDLADKATGYVTDAISSAYDSVMGVASETATSKLGEGAISTALEAAKQKLMETIYNSLPEELASKLFTKVITDEGGKQATEFALNETVGSVIGFIGTAYTAYSLIKIGLQLLTMCDENESDMGVKLGQRQCFKVGGTYCSKKLLGLCYQKRQDYCCYDSILARIIMEQAGNLLNKDMSSCQGLTQTEFSQLDFNQIDLSEWIGLLVESGEIKSKANEQILTGGGEIVPTECETWEEKDPKTGAVTVQERCYGKLENGRALNAPNRQVVSERTKKRTEKGANWANSAKEKAKEMANELDCSASPRPPVCDFGIDPRKVGGN